MLTPLPVPVNKIFKKKTSTDQLTNNSASHRFAKASVVKLTPLKSAMPPAIWANVAEFPPADAAHGEWASWTGWFCRLEYPECPPVTIWDSLPSHVLGCEKRKPRWETCHPHIFMWKLKQSQSYQPSQKGSGFTQSSWGSSWFRSLMVSYLFGWMLFHLLLCIAFTKEMFLTQSFKLSGLVILVPRYDDPHHLVVFCMDHLLMSSKRLLLKFKHVMVYPAGLTWTLQVGVGGLHSDADHHFARYTSVALALWSNESKFLWNWKKSQKIPPSHLHISYIIFSNVAFGGTKKWKNKQLQDRAMRFFLHHHDLRSASSDISMYYFFAAFSADSWCSW